MQNSLQNSAQLTHHIGANASGILKLRDTVNTVKEGYEHDITINDMICFAAINALKKHLM